MAVSRSKKVKFPYHDGVISESEGRASDDERLTAKGLRRQPPKEKSIYRVQKTKIQQPEISSFRSKITLTNQRELRVSNFAIFKEKAKFSSFSA